MVAALALERGYGVLYFGRRVLVAQLDRALASEAKGCGFESRRERRSRGAGTRCLPLSLVPTRASRSAPNGQGIKVPARPPAPVSGISKGTPGLSPAGNR